VPNRYLSEGAESGRRVAALFSRIARRYDLINDLMSLGLHRRWKRDAVSRTLDGSRRPLRLLDLCCGTGDIAFLAEEMGGGGVHVVGLDVTLPMLQLARRRRSVKGRRTALARGDALRLPFPPGTFDAVTIGYGLRNLTDAEAALTEILRALAPGGRLVVLDFGKPDNPVVAAIYGAFLRTLVPTLGWLFHGDAQTYAYIAASLERYPAQRGVQDLMRKVGFASPRYENRALGTMGLNIGEKPTAKDGSGERRGSKESFSSETRQSW
jgi:demethylmenaquinone methyltransferase/2-methoxy-6-polyprenyl-1,4-benzoquinol methylase